MALKKWSKRIGYFLLFVVIIIQFVPSNLESSTDYDPGNIMLADDHAFQADSLLIQNCMDCHSNHLIKPWYFGIRPLTFIFAHHVKEGREHLNFDDWSKMDRKEQLHSLEECIEEVEEGHMPLKSYTYTHGKLSNEDRERLIKWFESRME